jgi:hypothetical protein
MVKVLLVGIAIGLIVGTFVGFALASLFHVSRDEIVAEREWLRDHRGWPNEPPRWADA